ncbi:hypothetical protein BKA93DRAFT_826039 [Sparassis latifolia]
MASEDAQHNTAHNDHTYPSDEEHSVLEDDSDNEDRDAEYMEEDDGSSSLSIPNESIDFDLVYALHSFAATVEGQANVVKGDSLFLMDDSNSYWWLVRVLKTEEVGYIPAENIETPFERLARLNKHRNVDLASATFAELEQTRDRLRDNLSSRTGSNPTPSPTPGTRGRSRQARGVAFTRSFSVHRYPPAVWGDEEEDEDVEWDDEGYEDEDPELAEAQDEDEDMIKEGPGTGEPSLPVEPDDGMSWEEGAVEAIQARSHPEVAAENTQALQQQQDWVAASQQQLQPLRTQTSRERLTIVVQDDSTRTVSSPTKTMDPAQATETRKMSITPPVARAEDQRSQSSPAPTGPLLPSMIMQQQSEERKRTREEIEALEEAARKKLNTSAGPTGGTTGQGKAAQTSGSPGRPAGGAKLRKEREPTTDDESGKEKDKKKKSSGVFGGLFGRRKDKEKGKDRNSETGSAAGSDARESEESGRSFKESTSVGPPLSLADTAPSVRQPQSSQQPANVVDSKQAAQKQPQQSSQREPSSAEATPPAAIQVQLSQHASQLRQRDQQQQALYQQYLNRSPSTPPEAQPSYGLQSASAVMQGSLSFSSTTSSISSTTPLRPRPTSLVLSPSTMDGQGVGLPDLSVIRVFAAPNLQTEATFKTVLLNSSTTASDLVRQAIQRFRLPAGEDEKNYFLTIKQVEGSSAALLPHEKPLGVFESLVEAAMELPKVKRSSVGSISSVASNLSMHPAIKSLSMNDFTDDSAVKFYLNRKGDDRDNTFLGENGEDTLLVESPQEVNMESPQSRSQYLTVSPTTANTHTVTPERFSSPSYRFALQLVIYSDDLPDDMVFDTLTEAIVFKNTSRDRSQSSVGASSGISQTHRRKVFVFPKNVTVAEVIELGLERFGILEGVVDGGDEVEDKLTKRRSSSRVRYGLSVDIGGKERELSPSSKVVDAFPRPPTYRAMDRRFGDSKRRSVDSAQLLLGNTEDVNPEDPMFVLRRAVSYRTSRRRSSAPLDEIALQQLHRNSVASSSAGTDSTAGPSEEAKQPQTSKQAIIAAQRAASRANQRAILSAQANSARGLDVLLPGNAMIRSSRYEVDDKMRYSYVEPGGETYDISDIVEEEWRGEVGPSQKANLTGDDLLHGVLARKDVLGAKLDRVLSKIKHEKGTGRVPVSQSTSVNTLSTVGSSSPSNYSSAEGGSGISASREVTPTSRTFSGRSESTTQRVTSPLSRLSSYRTASSGDSDGHFGTRSTTPNAAQTKSMPHERQPSALSELSVYRTATPTTPLGGTPTATPKPQRPRLTLPNDDFGLSQMMAIIELKASRHKIPEPPLLEAVDDLLFGRPLDVISLHPQIRNIYHNTFKQLEEMDDVLDNLLQSVGHTF